ncbi:glycosyltransferase [Cellulomonas sp. ICMP 17802]|uniref:glycosyltransferase n=1 Tax=Cellulomonas sp. ICMP 17802 TaxID=3239199 RepID=UPI00351B0E9E
MYPAPVFDHLAHLSTPIGLFEHALLTEPRPEHGYCLDDVARALVVTARQPHPTSQVEGLTATYLRFTLFAQDGLGRFHNRRDEAGRWTDAATVEDHWGRALWALGTAAATTPDARVRGAALDAAAVSLERRSPWWHAMAYAALGAAEVLEVRPGNRAALGLLVDARTLLAQPSDPSWPWPDARLTYANALLPEALVAIGTALADAATLLAGLELLHWLVEQETHDGRLSMTPVGGRRPGDERPGFDQQPIEVAALAEACWRAFCATRQEVWLAYLDRCVGWFLGDNDSGTRLYDGVTGGGYDGLHAHGVNQNQGAESTLAALSTLQLGRLALVQAVA